MSDKGVCRTAPATPDLLIIMESFFGRIFSRGCPETEILFLLVQTTKQKESNFYDFKFFIIECFYFIWLDTGCHATGYTEIAISAD